MFSTLEASTPSRLLLQLLWQGLSAPAVVAPAPVSQPVPAISRPAPELQAPFMPSVLTSWSVQPRRSCTCTLILSDPDSGICPCIYNFIIIVPCSCTDVYAPVIHTSEDVVYNRPGQLLRPWRNKPWKSVLGSLAISPEWPQTAHVHNYMIGLNFRNLEYFI